MKSANEIRSAFLKFFEQNGHAVVPSSSLVPRNDPTLMFTNAGMVQFKNVFTGAEQRDYARAASAQKCVRAGGKHNDLDNVGYTARHHTFFEMLGNFSFGDYFKETAIELAWTLITREFGLAKDKLLVTVYHDDDQAFDLWRKIAGLPDDRIIRIPTSDNFWAMGDTGPCGPCSEIFYDHGPSIPGGPPGSPDQDGDRFIEIWNLVFMQYNQESPGNRLALPKPSIDTGMGLERLAAVLQGKHDNYDIDLMRSLIEASAQVIGVDPDGEHKVSHRVIADHLRSSSFLIADGVLPSNEGRGYVLRRIMRRAMRHAHMMGAREPVMHKLVPALAAQMGQAYPELIRAEALIGETLMLEETRFKQTLERGLRLLSEELGKLGGNQDLPGEIAFTLYDTYGFPLDLTQDALRAEGRGVDLDGFNTAMRRQREMARAAWSGSGEKATEQVWFGIRERHGATEFIGYDATDGEGQIVAIVVDGAETDAARPGQQAVILTNQTPFYAESGGQAGDAGIMTGAGGARFEISDTQKKLVALHAHIGRVSGAPLKIGDVVSLSVDGERRLQLRANHSATHLLHEALRRALGHHVTQKGSLVAPDRLRFDISHPKPVTAAEIEQVEAEVNRQIRGNEEVTTRLMTPDEAVKAGALALFGEKYGDEVRVVAMPGPNGTGQAGANFSIELCGGTHVRRTGDIGLFKIVAETAVAAGVRRIEAMTGEAARQYVSAEEQTLREAAAALKSSPQDVPARVAALVAERRRLEKELADLRRQIAMGGGASGGAEARDINGVTFISRIMADVAAKDLRGLVEELRAQTGDTGVVAVISVTDGKAAIAVGVTPALTARFSAVDLVRAGSAALGGSGGGGRPDMAQAGGPDGGQAAAAIQAIQAILSGS